MNKVALAEELARHLVFLHEREPGRFDSIYGQGLIEKARQILEAEEVSFREYGEDGQTVVSQGTFRPKGSKVCGGIVRSGLMRQTFLQGEPVLTSDSQPDWVQAVPPATSVNGIIYSKQDGRLYCIVAGTEYDVTAGWIPNEPKAEPSQEG